MKLINDTLLNETQDKANKSDRKRMNYNFHSESSDLLQRMLNVLNKGTYVQPHKHEAPDKREVFLILRGKLLVVEFDDNGNITNSTILDYSKGNYGVEIKEKTWHTVIPLEDNTIVYELKDGPYQVLTDKNFAAWAPKEGDSDCGTYVYDLLSKLNIF